MVYSITLIVVEAYLILLILCSSTQINLYSLVFGAPPDV